MKRTLLAITPILAVLGWMLVIFLLSSQTAATSNANSRAAAKLILRAAGQTAADNIAGGGQIGLEKFNIILRKCSHSWAYFVLAILTLIAAKRNRAGNIKAILISFAICAVYAVSDEIHQRFVPGRTSSIIDVIIDCFGVASGIAVYVLAIRVVHKCNVTQRCRGI